MDRDEVTSSHEFIEFHHVDSELLSTGRRDVGVVRDERDTETSESFRDECTDSAKPNNSDSFVIQLGTRECGTLPLALFDRVVRVRNESRE